MAETLTVVIDDGGTYTVTVRGVGLFTDQGLTSPASFPASVSAQTTWYAAAPSAHGRRPNIEVLVTASDGTRVQVDTFNSLPATVNLTEGSVDLSGPSSSCTSVPDMIQVAGPQLHLSNLVSVGYALLPGDMSYPPLRRGTDLTLGDDTSVYPHNAAFVTASGGDFEVAYYVDFNLVADSGNSDERLLWLFSNANYNSQGLDLTVPLKNGLQTPYMTPRSLPYWDVPPGGKFGAPGFSLLTGSDADVVHINFGMYTWRI